ncbi:helix-turn-helix domain-containing protein [Dellaglioa algida]|uniref:helix-turn-helix domain-containing protein n=1 Tax=Dellaglioa algida TaxID=105612 RepID=UPI0024C4B9DA|nr:helix-turn-helix domain-containing protein [Dellaglioa algida]MDK1727320.1 helix-turn-helix domain-containing protein [Dellaglioa algida]
MKKQYSIAELAEITGVNKQQVYRFIKKNHIKTTSKVNQKLLFDDVVKSTIMSAFSDNSTSKTTLSDTVNDVVLNQLNIKDQEIARLHTILDQQQKLTLQTNNQIANLQDKLLLLESQSKEKSIDEIVSKSEKKIKKHWWTI